MLEELEGNGPAASDGAASPEKLPEYKPKSRTSAPSSHLRVRRRSSFSEKLAAFSVMSASGMIASAQKSPTVSVPLTPSEQQLDASISSGFRAGQPPLVVSPPQDARDSQTYSREQMCV